MAPPFFSVFDTIQPELYSLLKAIVGSRHQRLKMADSESQPSDSRNIVMGIGNYLARLDIPKVTSEIITCQALVSTKGLLTPFPIMSDMRRLIVIIPQIQTFGHDFGGYQASDIN